MDRPIETGQAEVAMACRRVALFDHRRLLGESIERLLLHMQDIELLGPWKIDQQALSKLQACRPDVVIIVGDLAGSPEAAQDNPAGAPLPGMDSRLAAQILDRFNDLPVIRVDLEETLVRVYHMHALPAQQADLIQAILQAAS